jgi:CRISPR/Cas system-associated protein endoribonuclease Cas2
MKPMPIYYKVVSGWDSSPDKLESAFAIGAACVQYKLNKYVKAPAWLAKHGYHLLIFSTLTEAILSADSPHKIYECHARGEIKPLPRKLEILSLTHKQFPPVHLKSNHENFPTGTLMFKEVRLLRDTGH